MVDRLNGAANRFQDPIPDRLNGAPEPPPAAGRDTRGRFAPGNPGGPGRPPRATEALYALAVSEVVGLDRFRWMVEEQACRALKGDLAAAQWLARLLLGPNPPSLSAVLAGMLQGGPHYAVADALVKAEAATGPHGGSTRRERAAALADTLGDPDPPDQMAEGSGPDLETLKKQALREALFDVLGNPDSGEDGSADE